MTVQNIDLRVVAIGPMPPPLHGQSVVMSGMVAELSRVFPRMSLVDTGERNSHRPVQLLTKIGGSFEAALRAARADVVYISVKAGKGMWLTAMVAGAARLAGARVFLHHHGYVYIQERKARMVVLNRAAGVNAHHIVLSRSMMEDLLSAMPEITRVLVLNNSRWIDRSLLTLPLKPEGGELVLGHLSNLSVAKGIVEVVDLAVRLKTAGSQVRLIVGGPAAGKQARAEIERAARELGELFEYRGRLLGGKKRDFFNDITHFVFPSHNEALPLVLYEAMASGVTCLTTRVGSIAEQVEGSTAEVAEGAGSFVAEVLPRLIGASPSGLASENSRRAYLRALNESDEQLNNLIGLFCTASPLPQEET